MKTLVSTRATLNYLHSPEKKPYNYMFDPPPGVPAHSGETHSVEGVPIFDARSIAGQLSLDEQGFMLRRHHSAVRDFYDEEELRKVYYPEIESFLAETTGADKVVVFDHTVRSIPKVNAGIAGYQEPARRVHNDYTAASGRQRAIDLLSPEEAKSRLKYRFAEINVWRPIKGPLQDAPLAVCDARTIAPQDLIATDLIYRDRVGETYNVIYSPNHRWFYFPKMLRDEALLIKCFDSAEDGTARFTAHTAFDDPTPPPDALPRESIEVRALLFFEPD